MRGRGGGKSLPGGGCLDTRTKVSRTGQAGSHLSLRAAELGELSGRHAAGSQGLCCQPQARVAAKGFWELQRVCQAALESVPHPEAPVTRTRHAAGCPSATFRHSSRPLCPQAAEIPGHQPLSHATLGPELHPSPPVTVTPFGVTASVKPDEIANPGGLLTHRP